MVSVQIAGPFEEERWGPLVVAETVGEKWAKILGEI